MKKSIYSKKQKALQEALRDARVKSGLTQQQVADKLGRPQSFVAKYEGGERRLDVIEFLEVVEVIGIDSEVILSNVGIA